MTRLQRWLVAMGIILLAPACSTVQPLPKEVRIPVPIPCEVEQVPETKLPVAPAGANVAEKAGVAAARIALLQAENARLRAANTNPCPTDFPR